MGCGLRKLEDPEDSSPGKIYSTLKRPQVETKTDTVYEYVLLDFSLEGRDTISLLGCQEIFNVAYGLRRLREAIFMVCGAK